MDKKAEIQSFLTTRRARLSPDEAGLPLYAGNRRVPGLRREEVARLAGVSPDYYARLERGSTKGASREVLHAIARALQLDDTETQHLLDLVTVRATSATRRRPVSGMVVARGTQMVLDAVALPAFVQNRRLDIVAANTIGRALYGLPEPGSGAEPYNAARFQFLHQWAGEFYRDFSLAKRNVVALLRQAVGENPHDEEIIRSGGAVVDAECRVPGVVGLP